MADSILGLTHQGLPSSSVDNVYGPVRTTTYGEIAVSTLAGAKSHLLAAEGSYFSFCNATAGTTIADGNASGFVTTTPLLVLFNNNPTIAGGIPGKSIYMDFLDLAVEVAAGASSTNFIAASYVDTGNRYSSGGTAITPANVNVSSVNATKAVMHFGAVTATAQNQQVQIYNQNVRVVISSLGDKYRFRFGDTTVSGPSGVDSAGQFECCLTHPPLVIPPQTSWCLYTWGASQGTARQHTFVGGYYER